MAETQSLTQELTSKVTEKLTERKLPASKDIYVAQFREGPIHREYRFYAPAEDPSIEDIEKRQKDRSARIWRLCKRYERYLKSIENRKVLFVGVPQPFVIDFEAKMASFESNLPANTVNVV